MYEGQKFTSGPFIALQFLCWKGFSWWIQSSLISARLGARLSWGIPPLPLGAWVTSMHHHDQSYTILFLFPQYLQSKIQTEPQGQLCTSQFTTHMVLGFISHTPRWTEFKSLREPCLQHLYGHFRSPIAFLTNICYWFFTIHSTFYMKIRVINPAIFRYIFLHTPYHWTTLFCLSVLFILRAQIKASLLRITQIFLNNE